MIPFLGFDPAIRKSIYTTNAIESLNRVIGKSIKTRGSFPTDEAATTLICLAITLPAHLLLHQVTGPAPKAQGNTGIIIGKDRPQIAGANKLGNGAGVARIGLALCSDKTLSGAIDSNAGRVNQSKPLRQQAGFKESRERSEHIDADHDIAIQGSQIRNPFIDRIRGVLDRAVKNNAAPFVHSKRPMNGLCRINSKASLHLPASQ